MYTPPAFKEDDPSELRRIMRAVRLPTLVTATAEGLVATPLPLFLDEAEGEFGVLHGTWRGPIRSGRCRRSARRW